MVLLEILNRGVVQPRSDFMIRIVFKPKFDGPTSCSLRVRTNAAAPPSVGVGSSDAYGNNTSILEARLSGTGGVGGIPGFDEPPGSIIGIGVFELVVVIDLLRYSVSVLTECSSITGSVASEKLSLRLTRFDIH